MNYFFSALVIESGVRHPLQLVSLALIDEGGREYYAESNEYDYLYAPEPLRSLIPQSVDGTSPKPLALIAQDVEHFVAHHFPTFWGYNGFVEFTAFYQLFGTQSIPPTWPFYFHDFAVELERAGNPRPPDIDAIRDDHHALSNARWLRDAYAWLTSTHSTSIP